jgi:ABC-type nickel/cobalt efflux system permease component RcnA
MFMMFDKVLLMAEGGWVVYSGSAREIMNYFNSLGLYAPSTYNPADFACTRPHTHHRTRTTAHARTHRTRAQTRR